MIYQQFSFGSGEISKRMENRIDTKVPSTGLAHCENVIITPQGTALRRPGTDLIANYSTRLIYWIMPIAADGSTYILVFYEDTGKRVRAFTKDGANYSAVVSIPDYSATDYQNISFAQAPGGVLYMARYGHPLRKLTLSGATLSYGAVTIAGNASWAQDNVAKYPSCAAIWKNRLWLSGQPGRPTYLGASKANSYEDFTVGVTESDGIDLGRSGATGITSWLGVQQNLHQGCTDGEYAYIPNQTGRIVPDLANLQPKYDRHSNVGSTSGISVALPEGILHINGNTVRIIMYENERQMFNSISLTDHADIRGTIIQAATTGIPFPITWFLTSTGELYGLTFDSKTGATAWHRHTIWNLDGTQAQILSLAVFRDGSEQYVYLATKRNNKYLLERMRPMEPTTQNDAACIDCASSDSTAPFSINMDYLGNNAYLSANIGNIACMVDGGSHTLQTPELTGTTITPDGAESKVTIGSLFPSIMKTAIVRAVGPDGTTIGKQAHIYKATVLVSNSLGLRIGTDSGTVEDAQGREFSEIIGQAPIWHTGEIKKEIDGPYELSRIQIEATRELPFEIMGIIAELKSGA